jgi:hypothetical protein
MIVSRSFFGIITFLGVFFGSTLIGVIIYFDTRLLVCLDEEQDEDGERRPHWFTDFDEQYLKPVFCRYEFVVLYSRDKYKTRNEWIDTPPRVTSPFGSTRVGLMSEQGGSSRAAVCLIGKREVKSSMMGMARCGGTLLLG